MQKTKEINFQPHCVDSTKPENLISYTNIEVDGIVTFRGNSFRDTPSHGYADMTDFRLNKLWSADTGFSFLRAVPSGQEVAGQDSRL